MPRKVDPRPKTGKPAPELVINGNDLPRNPHGDFHVEPMERKGKRGSLSTYTEARAIEFLNRIADGKSIQSVCAADDMPCPATIWKWAQDNLSFAREFDRARDMMADSIAAQALAAATVANIHKDDVPAARLKFDGLRWYAGKVAPKRWGDKVEIEQKSVNVNITADITDNDRVRALAGLLAKTKAEREP